MTENDTSHLTDGEHEYASTTTDDEPLRRFAWEVFCRTYMANGLDLEKAAEAAGITKEHGRRLLGHVQVRRRLNVLLDAQIATSELDAAATLGATAAIAFADLRDVVEIDDVNGAMRIKNLKQLEKRQTYPIRKIKQTESLDGTVRTEIELESRVPALRLLNQHGRDLAAIARMRGDLPEEEPPAVEEKMDSLPLLEHDEEVAKIMWQTGIPQILDENEAVNGNGNQALPPD